MPKVLDMAEELVYSWVRIVPATMSGPALAGKLLGFCLLFDLQIWIKIELPNTQKVVWLPTTGIMINPCTEEEAIELEKHREMFQKAQIEQLRQQQGPELVWDDDGGGKPS